MDLKELKTLKNKYEELKRETIKTNNIYGTFNIQDIGEVLADLASIIIGINFQFQICENERTQSINIHNHTIHYKTDIATLLPSSIWNFNFAEASAPTEKDNITYISNGYAGEGTCDKRTLQEYEQLTTYIEATKHFQFNTLYRTNTADFICDFLTFVSDYRKAFDLKTITKEQLNQLMQDFLNKYETKYINYKEKLKSIEEFATHQKYLEEPQLTAKHFKCRYNPFNYRRRA